MVNKAQKSVPLSADEIAQRVKELESSLPREPALFTQYIYWFHNFWCSSLSLPGIVSLPTNFEPRDTDIILASKPKSGTTWLKAVAFSTLNRDMYPATSQDHPLLSNNPHQLIPFLEYPLDFDSWAHKETGCGRPRVFGTHLPYHALPESVKNSGCRIVYISRNVLDTAVSFWAFSQRSKELANKDGPIKTLEDYLDSICRGVEAFGPHWDHVLSYWEESLTRPTKVLFIKYEEKKADVGAQIKKLAEFIGCGFTQQEEQCGVIQEISKLCSFGKLKELEVNKNGGVTSLSTTVTSLERGRWVIGSTM